MNDASNDAYQEGIKLARKGDWTSALAQFLQAKQAGNNSPDLQRMLGTALINTGNQADAQQAFRSIVDQNPDDVWSLAKLLDTVSYPGPTDREIDLAAALLRKPGLNPGDQILLNFSLGHALHRKGDHARAFSYFQAGNELKARTSKFDSSFWTSYTDRLINAFNSELLEEKRGIGLDTDLPVFIVGTPRSGKSLLEHLLAPTPGLQSAGEVAYLPVKGVLDLEALLDDREPYPESIGLMAREHAETIGTRYLQHLQGFTGQDTQRVTDTIPFNMLHIGLIAILFPNARVIFCERNLEDAALDVYFKLFANRNDYSYRLEHIANYFWNFERLKQHWLNLLPIKMHVVRYEQLLDRPEETVRKTQNFLQLPDTGPLVLNYEGHALSRRFKNRAIHYRTQISAFRDTCKTLFNS